MAQTIATLHPDPEKQGVNIDQNKYEVMRQAILDVLHEQGEMTFKALNEAVAAHLDGNFSGSIGWYFTTIKLDLEARGDIERVPGSRPQIIRLT